MKLVKLIDIQDYDVPAIAHLFFFALTELQGNDMYYPQYTEQWMIESEPSQREEELYRKKIEKYKGCGVCCNNQKEMQDLIANPPSLKEAYKQVWKWLKEQGITEEDEKFLVKIWW